MLTAGGLEVGVPNLAMDVEKNVSVSVPLNHHGTQRGRQDDIAQQSHRLRVQTGQWRVGRAHQFHLGVRQRAAGGPLYPQPHCQGAPRLPGKAEAGGGALHHREGGESGGRHAAGPTFQGGRCPHWR